MRARPVQSMGVYCGVEEYLNRMYMYVRCMGDSIPVYDYQGQVAKRRRAGRSRCDFRHHARS